ncbi:ABC transporter substrate-binding protein [Myxococcota bacterium]
MSCWKRCTAWLTLAGVFSLEAPGCVAEHAPQVPRDSIVVGTLLPFTGNAANGYNLERAVLWAAERVNSVGGIAGHPIHVVSQDTHSSLDKGLAGARRLLDESNVTALLGPEEEDLATAVLPLIRERQVINVSGSVTSPTIGSDDDGYWFRMVPSATTLVS